MKLVKRTEHLNSRPVRPIRIGKCTFVSKNGIIYRTKTVIALHQCSADYIHFETQDAHYHLSFSPFHAAQAVVPMLSMRAA